MNVLLSKGLYLLWHLSNAFSTSMLEESSILYLLDSFFERERERGSTELLSGLLQSKAMISAQS